MTHHDSSTSSAVPGRIKRGSQVFAEIETKPPAVGMVYRMVNPATDVESVIWIKAVDQLRSLSYEEFRVGESWIRPVGASMLTFLEYYRDHQVFEMGTLSRKVWDAFLPILATVKGSGATFGEAVRILCTMRSFGFMEERGDDKVSLHTREPIPYRAKNAGGGFLDVEVPLTLETLGR